MGWPRFKAGVFQRADDWADILSKYGRETLVRRATRCGCIDPETRKADPMCEECHGFSWRYPAELEVTTNVQWAAAKASPRAHAQGDLGPGQYNVAWQGFPPTVGDVFVHPGEAIAVNEVLTRGAVAGPDVGAPSLEFLAFRIVLSVEHVADLANVYDEGADWSLGADGRTIEWAPGQGPEDGTTFTVRYAARGEYIIAEDPSIGVRMTGGQNLPYKATLHRYDPVARQPERNLTDQ